MPVSATVKTTDFMSAVGFTSTPTVPVDVNLSAFPTMLYSICRHWYCDGLSAAGHGAVTSKASARVTKQQGCEKLEEATSSSRQTSCSPQASVYFT